ncbi:Phytoene synthase 1 chloroplastic [Bienertia sinuspersici]
MAAWGKRSDAIVDGAKTKLEASTALNIWEQRLEDIFDGRPHDLPDTALAHTLQRFSLDIKVFFFYLVIWIFLFIYKRCYNTLSLIVKQMWKTFTFSIIIL